MADEKTIWRVTVTHPEGQPLFTVLIQRESGAEPKSSPPAAAAGAGTNRTAARPGSADGEPRMTEPQRRYLFRLLATQGIEGKEAEDHLKQYFNVKALREVPKASASQLIDQMVADRKEAIDGAA